MSTQTQLVPMDAAWSHRVYAALHALYGPRILEYQEWMLPKFQAIADGRQPRDVRLSHIEDLRIKLGIQQAAIAHAHGGITGTWDDEKGFADTLFTQLFVHSLPMQRDGKRIRFSINDYSVLQDVLDDDVFQLAGRLRAAGIAPEFLHTEGGMFVLPEVESEALTRFMEGKPAGTKASLEGKARSARTDLVTCDDIRLSRYYSVLPKVASEMQDYMRNHYSRLLAREPQFVQLMVNTDPTPFEDGFAKRIGVPALHHPSERQMVEGIKGYLLYDFAYLAGRPDGLEMHRKALEKMDELRLIFQRKMRAHMCLDQLSFKAHELVEDDHKPQMRSHVLSIPQSDIAPWLAYSESANIAQFFSAAGAGQKCAVTMIGHRDDFNGLSGRVIVTDPNAVHYLKGMGARIEEVPELTQLGDDMMRKRKDVPRFVPVDARQQSVLPMEHWAKKVMHKRALRASVEPEK